jgi:hypothetical protein
MTPDASLIFRLVDHGDPLSDAILAHTGGLYAHAECVIPGGTVIGAYALGGVQERPLNYDDGKFKRETFFVLPATADMQAKWIHFLRACIGETYAFTDVADFALPFALPHQHAVFCSALVQDSCRWVRAFPKPLPIPAHEVSPVMLQQMFLVRPDVLEIARTDPEFIAYVAEASAPPQAGG